MRIRTGELWGEVKGPFDPRLEARPVEGGSLCAPPKYPQGGPIFPFVTVKATTAEVNGLSSLAAFSLFQFESLDTGHSLCHATSPTSHSLLADQEAPDLEHSASKELPTSAQSQHCPL